MRVNYVIASWGGVRHGHSVPYFPVLEHLERLDRLDLSLISQITVGYPDCPGENAGYAGKLRGWRSCGGVPVVIASMVNEGLSYGQYSRIFELYSGFDYYIIVEDDFWPVLDGLDEVLVELYEGRRASGCGYLCGVAREDIACISNGIIPANVIDDVRRKHGCWPYQWIHIACSQVVFSCGITSVGYSICDYSGLYRSLFWGHAPGVVRQYGSGPDIWVPAEYTGDSEIAPCPPPIPYYMVRRCRRNLA